MSVHLELKRISPDAVGRAIEKAERYRLLNEPQEAESACLDVLEVDPKNQRALVVLALALTDQIAGGHGAAARSAREVIGRLEDEYERAYHTGIVCERQAHAALSRHTGAAMAYPSLREAMDWYEKAERVRPAGNDDTILRWNACLRTIRSERLEPRPDEGESPLE